MSELLPCPECGQVEMGARTETCHLEDGVTVKHLAHYRCQACGARFFDDEAMHVIQVARSAIKESESLRGTAQ